MTMDDFCLTAGTPAALHSGMLRPVVTLHVDLHDGDGPPMLLVHGLLSSRANWLANLDALATVVRPVVVELRGHGRSPAPAESDAYTPHAYLAEFEALRSELAVDRWFVCGHSLGAALTLRYACTLPERILGHVFTNSNSALAGDEWRAKVEPFLAADAERLERDGAAAIDEHPLHPRRGRRLPPAVRDALIADCDRHSPQGIARTLRHTVPASPVRRLVAANARPALLVAGEREESFAAARAYAESEMPLLSVVGAPDAGHAVNSEAADIFNRAVVEFVLRHRDG